MSLDEPKRWPKLLSLVHTVVYSKSRQPRKLKIQQNWTWNRRVLWYSYYIVFHTCMCSINALLSQIIQANDNGDHFPVWGTCLGFELLAFIASGNDNSVLSPTDASNLSLPLEFTDGAWCSLSPPSRFLHPFPLSFLLFHPPWLHHIASC